jgi:hypothetical protein
MGDQALRIATESEPVLALTDREARILEFERDWWRHGGAKEASIRAEFGFGVTEYYQVLNALLDNDAAFARDPMLVKRLRRMRDSRQAAREARQLEMPTAR